MTSSRLDRALAAGVAAVAVLNTLSALSMPVPDRKPPVAMTVAWLLLLAAHAALYWFGDHVRRRAGLAAYVAAQTVLLFTVAVTGAPVPVALGLVMAFTAEVVVLAGARWGTIRITLGAIALYVVALLLTQDLYRATTAGLLLAVTGVIAHAIAALVRRAAPADPVAMTEAAPTPAPLASLNNGSPLSPRETEVLRELARGARNSTIASKLGISERTVKAHLASIYQKLGVESRSAAVAAATQRSLLSG